MRGAIVLGASVAVFCSAAAASVGFVGDFFQNAFNNELNELHQWAAQETPLCNEGTCWGHLGFGIDLITFPQRDKPPFFLAILRRSADDGASEPKFAEAADALVALLSPHAVEADRHALLDSMMEDFRKAGEGRGTRDSTSYELSMDSDRVITFAASVVSR